MKNVKTLAYLMAIAMVSTFAMTSCKDEKEPAQQEQGSYTGETVKTEFSIAMPGQLGGPSRMPGATVQVQGIDQFNGLTGITLVPFAKQGAINAASDTRLGSKNITLDDLTKSEISGKTSKAKVYNDVSIPLNTASFLFYAKSALDNSGVAGKFSAGSLIAKTNGVATTWATDEPTNLTFDLEPIASDYANSLLAAGNGGKLLAYLSSIACASDGAGTPKRWYEYTEGDDAAMKAMFDTYTKLRYLSSFGVSRLLTDLYRSLKPQYSTSAIAKAVMDSINNATYAAVNGSDSVVLVSALQNYPSEINLPDGAISIRWDSSTHKFIEGLYPNMTHPENFVYPAQLWYYVNSQIKTSNTSKKTMYDNASNSWSTILDAHQDAISVNSLTRAVAIVNPIQYAVARFDVTVKLANNSMADNSKTAEGIATPVDVTAGFPVKAVFIGGQQQVKYDFTLKDALSTEYTIYDRTMANTWTATTAAPTASQINHTLVLENGTANVRIAIELENTGKDFYGFDNQLIPHGGKFYVCAELDHTLASQTDSHVFKQDFTTTANLTLQNLQKAYSTLPDLRTPQLELGFSVDLTWQAGHTYDINFE